MAFRKGGKYRLPNIQAHLEELLKMLFIFQTKTMQQSIYLFIFSQSKIVLKLLSLKNEKKLKSKG